LRRYGLHTPREVGKLEASGGTVLDGTAFWEKDGDARIGDTFAGDISDDIMPGKADIGDIVCWRGES
jgi:hypothetical protein